MQNAQRAHEMSSRPWGLKTAGGLGESCSLEQAGAH